MDFRTIKEFLKDSLKYIILIALVLLMVLYVVSLQQVIGPSMNPNYKDGDILLLSKLHYRLTTPKRFDVVVVKTNDKYLIKRVIGLPGEHVAYDENGILYINGNIEEEKFKKIDDIIDIDEDRQSFQLQDLGYSKIPDNYYLVVGDNRPNSKDSRSKEIGLISKQNFVGKVLIRIWPFIRK